MTHETQAVASSSINPAGRHLPRELNDDDHFVQRFSHTPRETMTTTAAASDTERLTERLADVRQSVIVASSAQRGIADIFNAGAEAAWPPGAESVVASPRTAGQ